MFGIDDSKKEWLKRASEYFFKKCYAGKKGKKKLNE